jgi:hypothetical protein
MNRQMKTLLKPIYIIGNSRSGTTLMANILGKNEDIFCFKELHFFEQHFSYKDELLSRRAAIQLVSKLLNYQRTKYGLFKHRENESYGKDAKRIVNSIFDSPLTSLNAYKAFLKYETEYNNCIYPCEQTPRYVFYVKTIKSIMPEAKFIHMVRDPRAVLLSQKNKWKIDRYGKKLPKAEVMRMWFNYHPILISKIWNKVESEIKKYDTDSMVMKIKFEELLHNPEHVLKKICKFLDIEYTDELLNVKQIGSSNIESNKTKEGFNVDVNSLWRKKLKNIDVYWCQRINKDFIYEGNYGMVENRASLFSIMLSVFFLILKAPFILYFNSKRYKNLTEAIKKVL